MTMLLLSVAQCDTAS